MSLINRVDVWICHNPEERKGIFTIAFKHQGNVEKQSYLSHDFSGYFAVVYR